jgi:hypothetical protein
MDFDAHTIEQAAAAAGPDAMQALDEDYERKIIQFFGAWIIVKRVEGMALEGIVLDDTAMVGAVHWAETIRQLPGFQIDRADFDGLPIFDFDFRAPRLPAGAHRLRFGDTWFLWKRAFIPTEMLYRVNLSTGPRWE